MMNYEIFKDVVAEKFLDFMPESYQDMAVRVKKAVKVNRELDGLILYKKDKNPILSPTLYINDMYEDYLQTKNLDFVLKKAADRMTEAFEAMNTTMNIPIPEIGSAAGNIVYQLVNTKNTKLLDSLPHREFHDLSIIYRWVVKATKDELMSILIDNETADKLEMNEQQLFDAAVKNTQHILPAVVTPIGDVMCDIMMKNGMPEEFANSMISQMPIANELWVISNEQKNMGAAAMLCKEKLDELAKKLDDDLYILPSSIHEVIAIPVSYDDPDYLSEMVSEINISQVLPEEQLSDSVYRYSRDTHEITVAKMAG